MTEREKLIDNIISKQIGGCYNDLYKKKAGVIADFILEDRKRIVNHTFLECEKIIMRYRDVLRAVIKSSEGKKELINELNASALNLSHCLVDIENIHKKVSVE